LMSGFFVETRPLFTYDNRQFDQATDPHPQFSICQPDFSSNRSIPL
jgi:hypothetical protein